MARAALRVAEGLSLGPGFAFQPRPVAFTCRAYPTCVFARLTDKVRGGWRDERKARLGGGFTVSARIQADVD
jgi:hypothetical protein